jgi:hypothetical protein
VNHLLTRPPAVVNGAITALMNKILHDRFFCKELSRFDEYHDPKLAENLPKNGYTIQNMRLTQRGIVAERAVAKLKRIVHAPVIIMFVSRKRLVDHTSGGVFRRAMIIVHGRLIRIDARDKPDNVPNR